MVLTDASSPAPNGEALTAIELFWSSAGKGALHREYEDLRLAILSLCGAQASDARTSAIIDGCLATYFVDIFMAPIHLLLDPERFLDWLTACLDGTQPVPQRRGPSDDETLIQAAFGPHASVAKYVDFLSVVRRSGIRELYLAATQFLDYLEKGCQVNALSIAESLASEGVTPIHVFQMLEILRDILNRNPQESLDG